MKAVLVLSVLLNLALIGWLVLTPAAKPDSPAAARYQICQAGIPIGETVPVVPGDNAGAKLVLVNFWNLSCVECLRETAQLNAMYIKYKNRGFSVASVNTDLAATRQQVDDFLKTMLVPYPTVYDPEGAYKGQYFVNELPASFLVDGQGRLVARRSDWNKTGYEGMEADIVKHLK